MLNRLVTAARARGCGLYSRRSFGDPPAPPPASATALPAASAEGQPPAPCLESVSAELALDAGGRERLHLVMLQHAEMQLSTGRVPDVVSASDWAEVLRCPSYSSRRKYFNFLFKREKAREAGVRRRQRRSEEVLARREEDWFDKPDHLRYGIGGNTIFHRINDNTMKSWQEQRLFTAMQFGQKLVLDLSFEPHMNRRECKNTARQLVALFSLNRADLDPFDLHVCNVRPDGQVFEFFRRHIPPLERPEFPLNIHTGNYLEMFPRQRLVYLTPHCRHELNEFDHEAVYVMGGLVDLVHGRPLSLAKAKREGLKMAKLPLQKYLSIGAAFKSSLTLVAVINILLELKRSGCWQRALEHVPRRGLMTDEQQAERLQAEQAQQKAARQYAEKRRRGWDRAASHAWEQG